jgi:hypothetical protein
MPKDEKSIQPAAKHRKNYVDAARKRSAEERARKREQIEREIEYRKMDENMERGYENHRKNRVK